MPSTDQVFHKRELEKGFYYAQAVKTGNTLYVSGCVSWDAAGSIIGADDMRAQVHAVYSDLKETLAAHQVLCRRRFRPTRIDVDRLHLSRRSGPHARSGMYRGAQLRGARHNRCDAVGVARCRLTTGCKRRQTSSAPSSLHLFAAPEPRR